MLEIATADSEATHATTDRCSRKAERKTHDSGVVAMTGVIETVVKVGRLLHSDASFSFLYFVLLRLCALPSIGLLSLESLPSSNRLDLEFWIPDSEHKNCKHTHPTQITSSVGP
jgi:hypothetical protein